MPLKVKKINERPMSKYQQREPTISLEQQFLNLDLETSIIAREKSTLEFKQVNRDQIIEMAHFFKEVNNKFNFNAIQLDQSNMQLDKTDDTLLSIDLQMANNCFIWRIDSFEMRFSNSTKMDKDKIIYSTEFELNGYKMALYLCPNGYNSAKGKYMSIFFSILRGRLDSIISWPYTKKLLFTLFDQSKKCVDHCMLFTPESTDEPTKVKCLQKPSSVGNPSIGIEEFIDHKKLWNGGFIENDEIFIKVREYKED